MPDHLRMNFRVVDEQGDTPAADETRPAVDAARRHRTGAVVRATRSLERHGLTGFPAEGAPPGHREGGRLADVAGHPALVDEEATAAGTVGVAVFGSEADQARAMRGWSGCWRLVPPLTRVRQMLTRDQQIVLATAPDTTIGELLADATLAAVAALLDWAGGPAWTAAGFEADGPRSLRRADFGPRRAGGGRRRAGRGPGRRACDRHRSADRVRRRSPT